MKTDVSRPLASVWQALSEVPGWPDAPLGVRLRRLWPLALPLAGCAALAIWTCFMREPLRDRVRAVHAELVAIEEETESLRQNLSDQTAAEISGAAAAARAQLLDSPAALQERLQACAVEARAAGWEATIQTYGQADEQAAAGGDTRLTHVPARVHLEPRPDNTDRFNSLIATLSRLAALPGHIDITRVSIRAEQPGVPVVDVNLRAACRPSAP